MAANPVPRPPELSFDLETKPGEAIVKCAGRVVFETTQALKETVKPLLTRGNTVVLDLTGVSYMDSSGLGAIVGLYVSAKSAGAQFRLINLNARLKELFSLTRLGEVMAEGRDPNDFGIP